MTSQPECPAPDASLETRQKSGISTDASPIHVDTLKRKRNDHGMRELLREAFVVKVGPQPSVPSMLINQPYPSTVFVRPRTLQPLMLLSRSRLSLSCLDIAPSYALPQSRLFEAHVKILELEERLGSKPVVLIARLDDGKSYYAVERESRGLYVVCKLGSWVDLEGLRGMAVVAREDVPKKPRADAHPVFAHQDRQTITPQERISSKKRLAIEEIQSIVKRSAESTLVTPPNSDGPSLESHMESQMKGRTHVVDPIEAQPTAPEMLDTLRSQYFDALYLSKASLAYFAKGPLSRARAAFHLDLDSTHEMEDLLDFLESLVLSTNLMDKKYRDGVPETVKAINVGDSDDEKPRKTRAKKQKAGKNGLYPLEDLAIRKWWRDYDHDCESIGPDDTRESVTRRRIGQLRVRETQLQMILILEILALRPQLSKDSDLPSNISPEHKQVKETKKKKSTEMVALLDLHCDRLCIWESVAKESTSDSQAQLASGKHEANVLRDFCVELIVPL
jgi:DNA replication regulator SLD3